MTIEILRHGKVLQRSNLPATQLPLGPLRIRAQREAARLTLQVADLQPVEIYDPFPVDVASAKAGLRWPGDVGLHRFAIWQHDVPRFATDIERADELFESQQFEQALQKYIVLAVSAADSQLRLETRAKQGMCLARLGRTDEAASAFEPLFNELRGPMAGTCRMRALGYATAAG